MASTALAYCTASPLRVETGTVPPVVDLRARAWPDCTTASFVAAWDALAQRAAEPNPFYESWYLLASLRALDPGGSVQLLVCEAGGQLVGLLPVAREAHYYGRPLPHLAGWSHANCFLGAPLVAAGREREFWRGLLGWADGQAGGGLFLHLAGMPLGGPLHRALDAVLAEQSRTAGVVYCEERALLQSADTPDTYLAAALTAKKRKELRRQRARLGELGEIEFTRRQDDKGLEGWIDSFLELEQAGWKGRAGSALAAQPATTSLLRDSLRGAAERGRLERLTLSLDGRALAMLASFIAPPGMFSFKTAYDEQYARFSPGVLLQCENLQALARPEISWSDSCAAADHPMIDHIWRERRAIGRISIAIGGKLRRAAFHTLLRFELARSAKGPAA